MHTARESLLHTSGSNLLNFEMKPCFIQSIANSDEKTTKQWKMVLWILSLRVQGETNVDNIIRCVASPTTNKYGKVILYQSLKARPAWDMFCIYRFRCINFCVWLVVYIRLLNHTDSSVRKRGLEHRNRLKLVSGYTYHDNDNVNTQMEAFYNICKSSDTKHVKYVDTVQTENPERIERWKHALLT